jgi:hypothetical protein
MMKHRFFNIAALLFVLLPCPSMAEDALSVINPEPILFKAIYNFELSGISLGKMGIEVQQTPKHYSIVSDIITTGLVKLFVKHSSHTSVDRLGQHDFTYDQGTYESRYQTRNKKKHVKMLIKDGITGQETLVPPDNPITRPPVAAELKHNVFDPLSLTLQMRQELWTALNNNTKQFSIPLYDGRRLTQVNFEVGERKTLRLKDGKVPVIQVNVSRKLIAGFTQKELTDYDPKEGNARFYFSDDKRLVPIRAEARVMFGTISATLAKECGKEESCLFGITE